MQNRRAVPGGSELHKVQLLCEARLSCGSGDHTHMCAYLQTPAHMLYMETHHVVYEAAPLATVKTSTLKGVEHTLEGVVASNSDFMPGHTRILMWDHSGAPSKTVLKKSGVADGGIVLLRREGGVLRNARIAAKLGAHAVFLPKKVFDAIKVHVGQSTSRHRYMRIREESGNIHFFAGKLENTGSAHTGVRSYDIFAPGDHSLDELIRGKVNVPELSNGHPGNKLVLHDFSDPHMIAAKLVAIRSPSTAPRSQQLDFAVGPASFEDIKNSVEEHEPSLLTQMYAYIQHRRKCSYAYHSFALCLHSYLFSDGRFCAGASSV
jgi:hypothetical protein